MTQIAPVTSEALQATIRRLLPSQIGFGEDLRATNLIQPVIDLTPTAEGSVLSQNLQTALAHGSCTAFDVIGATNTLVNTTGFFRVFGGFTVQAGGGTAQDVTFQISDGSTNKNIFRSGSFGSSGSGFAMNVLDFVVFLRAGDSLTVTADAQCRVSGSTRQIADVNGNLVNPVGFVFE